MVWAIFHDRERANACGTPKHGNIGRYRRDSERWGAHCHVMGLGVKPSASGPPCHAMLGLRGTASVTDRERPGWACSRRVSWALISGLAGHGSNTSRNSPPCSLGES